jgi:hypothetical protein
MHIAGTEHHVVRRPLPITGLDQFRTLAPTGGVPACLVDVLDRAVHGPGHVSASLAGDQFGFPLLGRVGHHGRSPTSARGHIEQVAFGSFRAKVYAGIDP